jgi:hypothetical protein
MERLTLEWATPLLAEFEARNKVGAEDGWTVLSQAIFCGRVTLMEPSFVSHSNSSATFFINVLEDGKKCVKRWAHYHKAELVALLNFMELLGDPPFSVATATR